MKRNRRSENHGGKSMEPRARSSSASADALVTGRVTLTDMDEVVGFDVTPATWVNGLGTYPVLALTLALVNVQEVDAWMARGGRSDDAQLEVVAELKVTPLVAEKLVTELQRVLTARSR